MLEDHTWLRSCVPVLALENNLGGMRKNAWHTIFLKSPLIMRQDNYVNMNFAHIVLRNIFLLKVELLIQCWYSLSALLKRASLAGNFKKYAFCWPWISSNGSHLIIELQSHEACFLTLQNRHMPPYIHSCDDQACSC